ncbi:MAG: AEC family transporter [Clostridia bacterium]|nr:AEC family transporter [Clostridia bacterium]
MDTFFAVLTPMLTLFFCIVIGFLLRRTRLLPDNAGSTMAKLETWVFLPALSFTTMARYCTVDTLGTHATNILLSSAGVMLAILISLLAVRFFAKKDAPERGVFLYALAFANSGYMGDPVVQALFGDEGLSYYKVYCLPISLAIYTWGISCMIPANGKGVLRRILNPPTVSLLLGMAAGLTGFGGILPTFIVNALNSLKACMGPVAMLLAGFTIAAYPLRDMLTSKRVYAASLLRLLLIPTLIISTLFGLKTLAGLALGITIPHTVLFYSFFAIGTPLGLNTVVFPAAYGGDAKTGAGMTMVSHTLAVLTIPLMVAIMTAIFGSPF